MRRILALWIACSAVAAAHAVPARPLYEPPAAETAPVLLDLRGTRWDGHFFGGACQVDFVPDGALVYRQGTQTTPGTWSQRGDKVFIEINRYSEHRGAITGSTIQGTSTNKAGQNGKFLLQRILK